MGFKFCKREEEKQELMDMLFYWAQPSNPIILS